MRTRGVGAEHDQRRADILAAVRAVAADQGIAAVSQSVVAAAAGVSPGRVQHYFPTKNDLLEATFAELNDASSARIAELVGTDLGQAPPRRVLETVLGELIPHDEPSRAHLQFRQAFTALALHHGAVAEQMRERYRRLHHHDLADLVRRDQRTGRIDADVEPVAVAIRLAALAEGLAYYVLIEVIGPEVAQEQLLAEVTALYPQR